MRDENGQLKKASHRFRRQADRVARLHQQLANVRLDTLHKLSTKIVDTYELIAIEDLRLASMTASAKGTTEKPGKNVRAKAGLNRQLLQNAMRTFRIMLEYKSEALGGNVIAIDPAYTSQTCSACNHAEAANRPNQQTFACQKCGYAAHADVNAARNILQKARGSKTMILNSTVMRTGSGRPGGKSPRRNRKSGASL